MEIPIDHSTLTSLEAEKLRLNFERALMEVDRMMMQTVQTALALIGFGFTITTFFNELALRVVVPSGGIGARMFGVSLLLIGLLFLASGTWVQGRYRRELAQRYVSLGGQSAFWFGLQPRLAPSFVSAVLLLVAGFASLVLALVRWLL